MEIFFMILTFLSGVAMFLFGTSMMSEGFEKSAGANLERTLEKFSNNVIKGALMGAAVTAVIQSSSATTVTVVGFVNSGIMKLTQAVGIIMGANIGTTITGQIVSLGDLAGKGGELSTILSLFTPKVLGPVAVIVGIIIFLAVSSKKSKDIASIFLGFGLLFIGLNTMSAVFSNIDTTLFENIFSIFAQNPILGVLAGAAVTAIIQSSSASVAILQAASSSGGITFGAAVPIILGQNIGTCITAILSSIGGNKNAKRAAAIHLYFNIIGTVIFLILTYTAQSLIKFVFWDEAVSMSGIAVFHTVFNVANTLLLLPFSKWLVKLAELTIPDKSSSEQDVTFVLEDRFLQTPAIAVEQCLTKVNRMGELAKANFEIVQTLMVKYDKKLADKFAENENSLDKLESALESYILKLTTEQLTVDENKAVSGLLHAINDFERIGDYAENLIEVIQKMIEDKISFTKGGAEELKCMEEAVNQIIELTCSCYKNNDLGLAKEVEPLEEVIDLIKETLKNKHIIRLQKGECSVESGISFLEIINNLERIADHCSSIAVYVMQMNNKDKNFDFNSHEYIRAMHRGENEEYKTYFKHYEDMYFSRIAKSNT